MYLVKPFQFAVCHLKKWRQLRSKWQNQMTELNSPEIAWGFCILRGQTRVPVHYPLTSDFKTSGTFYENK